MAIKNVFNANLPLMLLSAFRDPFLFQNSQHTSPRYVSPPRIGLWVTAQDIL